MPSSIEQDRDTDEDHSDYYDEEGEIGIKLETCPYLIFTLSLYSYRSNLCGR